MFSNKLALFSQEDTMLSQWTSPCFNLIMNIVLMKSCFYFLISGGCYNRRAPRKSIKIPSTDFAMYGACKSREIPNISGCKTRSTMQQSSSTCHLTYVYKNEPLEADNAEKWTTRGSVVQIYKNTPSTRSCGQYISTKIGRTQ